MHFLVFASFISSAQQIHNKGHEKTIDSLLFALKTTKEDTTKINILLEINWNYISMGSYEAPLQYALQAFEIANKTGNKKLISITLRKIGNVYLYQLNYEKSLKYYLAALKVAEETNDDTNIANSLNNIGNVYSRMAAISNAQHNYEKSLEFHLRSIDFRKKASNNPELTNSLLNISNAYRGLGQQEKAIEYLLQALKEYNQRGDENGEELAKTSLGEVYLDLAKKTGNKEDFTIAEKYFSDGLAINPRKKFDRRANLLIGLGEICFLQKRQNEAINYLTYGIELAKRTRANDALRNGALLLSEALNAKKDYKQALEYHKLFTDLKDTLLNDQSSQQIAEMNT